MARSRQSTWASGGRKRTRRRRKQPGLGTILFSIATLLVTIIAAVTQVTLAAVAAGLLAAGSAIAWHLETRDWGTVPPATPVRPGWSQPRPVPTPGGSPGKSGTGGARKPRRRVCSARCRASKKPKDTCGCVCQGKTHGVAGAKTSA